MKPSFLQKCAAAFLFAVAFSLIMQPLYPQTDLHQDRRLKAKRQGKVPKILHFTVADNPPPHQMEVIAYSTKHAISNGYEVMVHHDSDGEELIKKHYPDFVSVLEKLKARNSYDRGTRISDMLRLIFLHHYGGFYVDADMVICSPTVNKFINEDGFASFIKKLDWDFNPGGKNEVLNYAMAAPRFHPAIWAALEHMRDNEDIADGLIIRATGPLQLGTVLADRLINVFKFSPSKEVDKTADDNGWYHVEDMRFKPITNMDGLRHLQFRTWQEVKKYDSKEKTCEDEKNFHMIPPFLDHICDNSNDVPFNSWWWWCGNPDIKESGLMVSDK